ncbi:MAG TPA: glycosyltransferase family A protein [Ohtaekwangia sp.]
MINKRVSIIIPHYNRIDLIRYTLDSVLTHKQGGVDLEIIVVDDASKNEVVCELKELCSSVRLILNEKNQGAPACRNQGLNLATGDFVLFLDSDDLIAPDFFVEKIIFLQKNSECNGVYGPWEYFESDHEFAENHIRPRHSRYPLYPMTKADSIICNLLQGWFIPINAVVWRTAAVKKAGGFTEGLIVNQDVDLVFKMLTNGVIAGIESPKALIRIHQGERVGHGMSEKKLSQILQLRKAFVRLLSDQNKLTESHKEAVASYIFNMWAKYRKEFPRVSSEMIQFSKLTYPKLKLKGTVGLQLVAFLLGNERAIIIKQYLQQP